MSISSPSEMVAISTLSGSPNAGAQINIPGVPGTASFGPISVTQIQQITNLNTALVFLQLDLPKMESFWFTAKDGTKLEGFLIRPPGFDATKKYPVKFLIHGGPQGDWGDDWSYRWNAELFAANGYVVIMINCAGRRATGRRLWTASTATGAASPLPT